MVNPRKEFYRSVSLEEIEAFVRQRGLSAQFVHVAEAKEYRETLAMVAEAENRGNGAQAGPAFKPDLFERAAVV